MRRTQPASSLPLPVSVVCPSPRTCFHPRCAAASCSSSCVHSPCTGWSRRFVPPSWRVARSPTRSSTTWHAPESSRLLTPCSSPTSVSRLLSRSSGRRLCWRRGSSRASAASSRCSASSLSSRPSASASCSMTRHLRSRRRTSSEAATASVTPARTSVRAARVKPALSPAATRYAVH